MLDDDDNKRKIVDFVRKLKTSLWPNSYAFLKNFLMIFEKTFSRFPGRKSWIIYYLRKIVQGTTGGKSLFFFFFRKSSHVPSNQKLWIFLRIIWNEFVKYFENFRAFFMDFLANIINLHKILSRSSLTKNRRFFKKKKSRTSWTNIRNFLNIKFLWIRKSWMV